MYVKRDDAEQESYLERDGVPSIEMATKTMWNDDLEGYRNHCSEASYMIGINMSKGACQMGVEGFDMKMNKGTSRKMMLRNIRIINNTTDVGVSRT